MLNQITPLILTFNEAPNIARTLSKLAWARDVVIVDSHSTDGTREIAAAAHPGVRWFPRRTVELRSRGDRDCH
jgi:glycosyltransferase involved in cell wall biosynthesis